MKGVSVVICCYNSEKKIAATLEYLSKQKEAAGISFELLLVDNNCSDQTVALANSEWSSLGNQFPLRVIAEQNAGLNFARKTGIENALYEYIVLCDDDNWLCNDYLLKVYHLFETMPSVAIAGGVGEAVSDIEIPAWFKAVNGFGYAVGKEGRQTGITGSVYGAGMALRKNSYLSIPHNDFALTDRKADSLSSGGDTEICLRITQAGYQVYLDESLSFRHFINRERLTWNYYLRLRRSFGKANARLEKKYALKDPPAGRKKWQVIKFGLRNIKYLLFPNWQKSEKTAATAQEWSRQLNSINNLKEDLF